MEVRVVLDRGAKMPTKAHESDAGFDLYTREDGYVAPNGWYICDTGVHMEIPKGYVGFLKSKSGLNVKHGLRGEGVIDSGYTGSIVAKIYNDTDKLYAFNKGDKVIQIVLLPIPDVDLIEVDTLEETERGNGGFGSSGI